MQWYFCLEHARAEPEGQACKADNRLGPYASQVEAENWRDRHEHRSEDWEEQDRAWDGDVEDQA